MLVRPNNKKAITMQAKEILVRLHAFLLPPIVYGVKYEPSQSFAHFSIINITVDKDLFCNSGKNAPGPNMYNLAYIYLRIEIYIISYLLLYKL